MAGSLAQFVFVLLSLTHGCLGQTTANCGEIQTFSQGSFVCAFPPDCCTRLLCSLSFLIGEAVQMDIRINPCTDPTTLSIVVDAGGTTIFNMSGISTSQSIPISYGGLLDTSIDIFFNSTMNSATIGLSTFGVEVIPPTTIDISDPGCQAGSMSLPPACFATQAPPTSTPSLMPPASGPTCDALQQLAGGGNIALPNSCVVIDRCTTVSCNYLDLFPISLTLLPCNDPPGIKFVAYNSTNGVVVFNETVTDSRRISLDEIGAGSAIIININRPCGQDAIIAEVIFSTIFNSTILPPTTIPIDRSNCTTVAATVVPCDEPVTSFNDICDAVQSSFQSTASSCTTNYPDCTTTTCDLSQFTLPVMYGYTILPCTEIPSVMVYAINNGTLVLNETLSDSRVETINVGPTNVSVRFIVSQSPPDYQSIGVGVNLISTNPPIDVPVFPTTSIPLDRCSCDTVTCTSGPGGGTTAGPVQGMSTARDAGNPGVSSSSDSRVIAPAVIAAILFVALVAVIVVAIVLLVWVNRKHTVQIKSMENVVSYKNLSTQEENKYEYK